MDIMLSRIRECMGPTHGAGKALADYLGVSPNVVTNWKNGSLKSYRKYIEQIAEFYHVPVSYLKGETDKKENLTAQSHEVSDDDIKFALFGGGPVTDAQYEEVKQFVRFIKERDAHEQKDKLYLDCRTKGNRSPPFLLAEF